MVLVMNYKNKKGLKIWILKDGETLPVGNNLKKMRTWRLSEALADRGHSVTWWSSNFSHSQKEKICEGNKVIKLRNNLSVKLIDCGSYKRNISFQRIKHHFILGKKFSSLAKEEKKPDIIISSLPILEFPIEAITYGKLNKVPIIIDVRDMWPDIFLSSSPWFLRPFVYIPVFLYNKKINFCLKNAQGIVAMSEDLLTWALGKAKLKKDKNKGVFYLGYDESSFKNQEVIEEMKKIPKDKTIFSYLGSFNGCNEPELIVEAAKVLDKDKNFHGYFILAGNGNKWIDIKEKTKKMNNLILLDWINKEQSSYLMNKTNVSIIPSRGVATPNKLFEALFFGKPIIFCMKGESKSILESHGAGIFYEEGKLDSLVLSIKNILEGDKFQEMKNNSRLLYDTKFKDHKIYSDYCDYIEEIYSKSTYGNQA